MRFWGLLLALLGAVLLTNNANAQSTWEKIISPGPLSSAHAKLEKKCDSCHKTFKKEAMNGMCLSCHKGIAGDINQSAGFHGKSTARSQQCKTCHSEHHGRGYQIVSFKASSFNHNLTDYPLVGGHTKATCAGCHSSGASYRTTSTACASCHSKKDPHLGRLGRNCQGCHTVTGWKNTLPYNHAKTGFPLTGEHRGVRCMGCHAGQRWQGLPQQCIGCHAKNDVHRGSRGINCASCHSPASWKAATFNHNRDTAFPLIGRHGATACAGCHGVNNSIRKPQRTCIACHAKDDTHKGSRGTACNNCHTPKNWQDAKFDHDTETRFPLKGAHEQAACTACHGAGNSIKKPPMTCIGCHAEDDSHKGRNGPECEKCHNSKDWKQTQFDHNKMTNFPLLGKHKAVLCEACHTKPTEVELPPVACIGCHAEDDPHRKRLGDKCDSCHNADSWKERVLFDHDLTRFPLTGKHVAVTCEQCHADKSYAYKGITCQSCHIDEHHAGSLGATPTCAKCHNVNGWKLWSFDHDVETGFILTGKHKGLICTACHKKGTEPKDVSSECGDCHQRDDVHNGEFGSNCARCHTTDNFTEILM
jgi:hypothetical protein